MPILIHVSTIIADAERRILFVREAKPVHCGLWNLPGGHVEIGEHPTGAAVREVLEETLLEVSLGSLVGVYSGISPSIQSIRFVFEAASYVGLPRAGDEILEVKWMSSEEVLEMSDSELVGSKILRVILSDWQAGLSYPLAALSEL